MSGRRAVAKVSAVRSEVMQAVDAMSGDLLAVYERLRGLTRDGANSVIDYYMKIGAEVIEVQKHLDVYGDSALVLLTKALMIEDESTLRRAAQIRGLVTDSDIEKIKKKNDANVKAGGRPVAWSHLQTLTYNVSTRKELLDYLEMIWEKDLSIRDLRNLLRGEPERAEPAVPALPGGLSRSTDNISARSHSLVAIIDKYSEFFADDEVVDNASKDPDFKVKAAVAAANLRKLAEHANAQADNLSKIAEEVTSSVPALPAAPPEKPASVPAPAPAPAPTPSTDGNLQTSPKEGKTRRPV